MNHSVGMCAAEALGAYFSVEIGGYLVKFVGGFVHAVRPVCDSPELSRPRHNSACSAFAFVVPPCEVGIDSGYAELIGFYRRSLALRSRLGLGFNFSGAR